MGRSVTVKKIKSNRKSISKKNATNKTNSNFTSSGASAATAVLPGNGFVMPTIMLPKREHGKQPGTIRKHINQAIAHAKRFALTKADETAFFAPKTWAFWRGIIMYFFLFSVVGHWLEIPYCLAMHSLFGIVETDYAMWSDPLWVPYWVYGAGAAVITLLLLPLKIRLVGKRKTMWGAALEFFVIAVVMCAALECIMGWICNQPDQFGEYPYWDNSQLPLNIFGQAWLVNDIFLGLVSLAYVWMIFPFCQKACSLIGERASNRVFVLVLTLFAVICIVTYVPTL